MVAAAPILFADSSPDRRLCSRSPASSEVQTCRFGKPEYLGTSLCRINTQCLEDPGDLWDLYPESVCTCDPDTVVLLSWCHISLDERIRASVGHR